MDYLRDNLGKVIFLVLIAGVLGYWQFKPNYQVVGEAVGQGRPAVILLHGFGAAADDLVPLGEELARAVPGASFLVPGAPHRSGCARSWEGGQSWEAAGKSRQESIELVQEIIDDLLVAGVGPEDIYLAGFSQGAAMASLVMTDVDPTPDLRGLILMGGQFFPALPGSQRRSTELPGDFRVLVTHGKSDRVVSMQNGRQLAKFYEEAGAAVEFVEFDGGHSIPREPLIEFLQDHE